MNKVKAEKKKKNQMFIAEIRRRRAGKKFKPHRQVKQEMMDYVRRMVGCY